jgi:hypothetical protein
VVCKKQSPQLHAKLRVCASDLELHDLLAGAAMTVHRVYWTEDGLPKSQSFEAGGLDEMLKYCEALRKERIAGKDISFIISASENPDCTSLQGVDVVGLDYNWTKRRGGRR